MVMNILNWLWRWTVEYSKKYFERILIEVINQDLLIPVESQDLSLETSSDIFLNVDKEAWLDYSNNEIILELKC